MAQQYVRGLCPMTPGRQSVADVRPISTLRPGECYAVLAEGADIPYKVLQWP